MKFDPAGYPGPRPAGPVLLRDGRLHPLAVDGDARRPWRRLDGGAVPPPEHLRLSVAYGANASPPRLIDKGMDQRGAVLLPARMRGWTPVFEARRTGYGAVPLTLVPARDPAEVRDVWVLGVHTADTPVLDRSEGRVARGPDDGATASRAHDGDTAPRADDEQTAPGGSYVLAVLGPVTVARRFLLRDALAYRPGPGTRLLEAGDGPMAWPEYDQEAAWAAVGAGAPSRHAPAVERVVTGPWPPTPLVALPG